MTALALTGAGNVTTANFAVTSTTATASKPGNTADGDLLVCGVYFRTASGSISAPGGWSSLGAGNNNGTFAIFAKPILDAATEGASYSFTGPSSTRGCILITRVIDALLANPFDAVGASAGIAGTTTVVLPSVTAVSAHCLLIGLALYNSGGTASAFAPDGSMTEIGEISVLAGGSTSGIQLSQQQLFVSGITGSRSPSISPAASNSGGLLVTIKPGSSAPGPGFVGAAVKRASTW